MGSQTVKCIQSSSKLSVILKSCRYSNNLIAISISQSQTTMWKRILVYRLFYHRFCLFRKSRATSTQWNYFRLQSLPFLDQDALSFSIRFPYPKSLSEETLKSEVVFLLVIQHSLLKTPPDASSFAKQQAYVAEWRNLDPCSPVLDDVCNCFLRLPGTARKQLISQMACDNRWSAAMKRSEDAHVSFWA